MPITQLQDQQVLALVQHLYNDMMSEENQKLLDPDHLDLFKKQNIKPLYPHKYVTEEGVRKLQKYSCGQICCELSPGSTCCGCFRDIRTPDQVYREFGLGANIYFNFMKHFSCCYFVLALFSLVSIALCYYITVSNSIDPMSEYQVFFYSGTMGSLSANFYQCKYALESTTTPNDFDFDLSCSVGQIYSFGPVLTSNSQQSIQNCLFERRKYQEDLADYKIATSTYTISNTSCSTSACKVKVTFSTAPSTDIIAFSYACNNPIYTIFDKPVESRYATYVIVGIDLFITVGLLFFLCSQKEAQQDQIQYFKSYQLNLSDFGVKLKGFTHETFDEEFQGLVDTLNSRIEEFVQKIVQVKIPEDKNYIAVQELRKQKYKDIFEFMERNFFDDMINPNEYNTAQEFISNLFGNKENYQQFKKEFIEIVSEFHSSKKASELGSHQFSLYMILLSSKDRRAVQKIRQQTCCHGNVIRTKSNQYKIQEAPVPDMLQWHNKTKWTGCRLIISWIITLLIVVGSYILFGLVQWKQNTLLAEYDFDIDCTLFYTSADLTTFDNSLYTANQVQYTHCYCFEHYLSLDVTDEVSSHCSTWWSSYLSYLLIPLFISIGIVIYNLVVSIIFKMLTKCQGHFLITDELFSYTIKRSFILIMNMGLIIVLLNFNYSGDLNLDQVSFLFQGKYDDLTSDWYIKIGSIVIMTMLFNIFFPFLELMMHSGFKCLRKCVDKRCWTRKTSQKYKADYISLYAGDVYPIEQRYAFIISIFWITMIFNVVIPFLNVIAALSFMLLELIDRVLVFKFFKTPINYDQSLHHKVMNTLYISLIVHMVSSAFLLSEPNLLADDSSFTNFSALDSNNQRMNRIITTYYIIPYVVLFILLIAYAFLKSTLCNLFQACCGKKFNRSSAYKEKFSQNFFESLSQYQLLRLKLMTEKQLTRVMNQQRRRQSFNVNLRTDETQMDLMPVIKPKTIQNSQLDILGRTITTVEDYIAHYKANSVEKKAKLIGMPGYDMGLNQSEFQKERRILNLDSVINRVCLKDRRVDTIS